MAKVLSILFVVAMGLSMGCGGDAMGELESIKTDMCACENAACAKEVGETMKSKMEGMSEPTGEDKEKAEKILGEIMKCTMKAAMKG